MDGSTWPGPAVGSGMGSDGGQARPGVGSGAGAGVRPGAGVGARKVCDAEDRAEQLRTPSGVGQGGVDHVDLGDQRLDVGVLDDQPVVAVAVLGLLEPVGSVHRRAV